ncbi:MAG: carboxypeptidase-like regulatory domain-containing protein [Myxococcota bacterium]
MRATWSLALAAVVTACLVGALAQAQQAANNAQVPGVRALVTYSGKGWRGPAPKRAADPTCGKPFAVTDEQLVISANNNGLLNTLVYVSKGAPTGKTGESLELAHQNCTYRPRVAAVVAGSNLRLTNADAVPHQLHAYRGIKTILNQSLEPGGAITLETREHAGQILRFHCDVHPGAISWVHVLDHPFFAVTNERGEALLPELPPGQYTVTAWHEKFGPRTADLTVTAGQPAEVKFVFDGTEVRP